MNLYQQNVCEVLTPSKKYLEKVNSMKGRITQKWELGFLATCFIVGIILSILKSYFINSFAYFLTKKINSNIVILSEGHFIRESKKFIN